MGRFPSLCSGGTRSFRKYRLSSMKPGLVFPHLNDISYFLLSYVILSPNNSIENTHLKYLQAQDAMHCSYTNIIRNPQARSRSHTASTSTSATFQNHSTPSNTSLAHEICCFQKSSDFQRQLQRLIKLLTLQSNLQSSRLEKSSDKLCQVSMSLVNSFVAMLHFSLWAAGSYLAVTEKIVASPGQVVKQSGGLLISNDSRKDWDY